jgi:hypothetical protein
MGHNGNKERLLIVLLRSDILKLSRKIFFIATLMSTTLYAGAPQIDSISQQDVDELSKEFSANLAHTAVSPAGAPSELFEVEVGVIAGITKTPKLQALVKEVDPDTDIPAIPHAGIVGIFTGPMGISAEVNLLPKIDSEDFSLNKRSFGLRWSFLRSVPLFGFAFRGHYSASDISFNQNIQNSSTLNIPVASEIKFKNRTWGANFSVDLDLFLVTPYLGYGIVRSKTNLDITGNGTATIFDTDLLLTSSQAAQSKNSSDHIFAGVEFNLFLVHISAEYAELFDTKKYSIKLSAYF